MCLRERKLDSGKIAFLQGQKGDFSGMTLRNPTYGFIRAIGKRVIPAKAGMTRVFYDSRYTQTCSSSFLLNRGFRICRNLVARPYPLP